VSEAFGAQAIDVQPPRAVLWSFAVVVLGWALRDGRQARRPDGRTRKSQRQAVPFVLAGRPLGSPGRSFSRRDAEAQRTV